MADQDVLRMVKIKTGTVRRLHKDFNLYRKEYEDEKIKVEKMKEENCDEYDIKQQLKVLDETISMIPDCRQRLEAALVDLKAYLDEEGNGLEGEEVETARSVAAEAELVFEA